MTLLYHTKNSTAISNSTKSISAYATMLFVLLFLASSLAHADHLFDVTSIAEQQECHICHQGIDAPPELSQFEFNITSIYSYISSKIAVVVVNKLYFIQPQLRAPPSLQ